jgi:hypothetical protein
MDDLEADYVKKIKNCMLAIGWVPQDHQDKVWNFIPDLSFAGQRAEGWMEVKWANTDPVSLGALRHWTHGQEEWLRTRGRVGSGNCYLLLGTSKANYLWRWDVLDKVRGLPFDQAVHYCYLIDQMLWDLIQHLSVRVRVR